MTSAWIALVALIAALAFGRDVVIRILADRADGRVKRTIEVEARLTAIDALLTEQSKAIASLSKKVNERIAERIRR